MTKKERIEMLEKQLTSVLTELAMLKVRVSVLESAKLPTYQNPWRPGHVTCGAGVGHVSHGGGC